MKKYIIKPIFYNSDLLLFKINPNQVRKFVKLLVFFTFYGLTGVATTAQLKLPSVTGIGPDSK